MSYDFTCLVAACGGDLYAQLACDPAQAAFVSVDERGKAVLNIERHELRANRVTDKRRLDDAKARSQFAHGECRLQVEQAQ